MVTGAPRLTRWKNGGVTTLAAAITTAGQTTMQVSSAAPFPTTPEFTVTIGDVEIVLVTAISGTTFTIVRGRENTTAVTHSSGTAVKLYNTAGSMDKAYQDGFALADYPMNRVLEQGTTRTESDFTWVNQGSATSQTADDGGILVTCPSEALHQIRLKFRSAPVTPYKITTFCMLGPGMKDWDGSNGSYMGPLLREASTGKLYMMPLRGDLIALWRMTSPTAFSAGVDTFINNNRHAAWLQLEDDGTDVRGHVSFDGYVWEECFNEGRTSFMTGGVGPDQVGFGVSSGNGTAGMHFYFKSWILE